MRFSLFLIIGALCCWGATPAMAQPANDECTGATPVFVGSNAISNLMATLGADPLPALPCTTLGAMDGDVWYSFTAGTTGLHEFNTCNGWDTDLAVYDGTCGALVQIACNGDGAGLTGCVAFYSRVQVALTAGATYLVRIGSWDPLDFQSGTLTIVESGPEICNDSADNDFDGAVDCADADCAADPFCAAPGNDDCVGATPVFVGANAITNLNATNSAEPAPVGCAVMGANSNDVFYTFTAASSVNHEFNTCAIPGWDTSVTLYEGTCGALVQVACNGDGTGLVGCQIYYSRFAATLVAGVTYTLRVASYGAATEGSGTLNIIEAGPEDCFDGIDNDFDGLTDCGDTVDCGALPTCDESLNCADAIDNDLDGNTDCNDIDCAGDPSCAALGNDICGGALPINCGDVVIGDTTLATAEAYPICGTNDGTGGGLWYSFVGNGDQVTLNTCQPGTTYDTKIRVWEDCAGTICVTGNDDVACTPIFRSEVQWLSTPGTTYYILVHGFGTATGIFEMAVSCLTPGAEDCTDGLDNDLDGLVDCDDTVDCPTGVAPCIEDCADGIDNDADGLVDCADAIDCGALAQCNESLNCSDGLDNDVDGLADCLDVIDCPTGVAPCVPPSNDDCSTPSALLVGTNPYDTTLATDSIEPDSGCPGANFWGAMSHDIWWTFTATVSGAHRVETCGTGHDSDLEVYDGTVGPCDTSVSVGCSGDSCGLPSQVNWSATAGVTYTVRVGSWAAGAGANAALILTVGATEDCTDALDNDFDGLTDCADSECACDAACVGAVVPGVSNLIGSADCVAGDVTLSWDPAPYDSYVVQRDGVAVSPTLPAGTTSYTDLGVANGTYFYEVVSGCISGNSAISSVTVSMAAYGGEQDLVVVGELASTIDSAAALTAQLTTLGRTYVVWTGGIADYACNSAPFEIIWLVNGSWPDHRCLTAADGLVLETAHAAGASIYLEGGDQFGFCALTQWANNDGVASALDGDDTFTAMDGFDSGLGLDASVYANVPYTQDQAGNDYTDRMTVAASEGSLSAAAAIWGSDDALPVAPYTTGVYGLGIAPAGNVISSSWEFGGFGGDQNALATDYVAALGGGAGQPEFKRGDTNNDGGLNIADAVYVLGALFPPPGGSPNVLACRDTGDGNDDGGINIADAVAILASLFGSPAVPLPAPGASCGVDPTSDALDCLGYSHCP